jgi:HEAT repeat protein
LLLTEGDENAVRIVTALLEHPTPKVQLQAALLLALWNQDPKSIKVLQERYTTSDFNTKMQILEALGRLGDKSTLPFLNERLYEPSQTLRVVAACAILLHIFK